MTRYFCMSIVFGISKTIDSILQTTSVVVRNFHFINILAGWKESIFPQFWGLNEDELILEFNFDNGHYNFIINNVINTIIEIFSIYFCK